MGALSASIVTGPEVPGNRKIVTANLTGSASYATGGETLSFTLLGLTRLDFIVVGAGQGYLARWDGSTTAPKVVLYQQSAATGALTEVPNATNISTVVIRVLAFGA